MKCPNCGAEIGNSTVCEYCGSHVSAEMKREQEIVNKSGCPKCGSGNITFKRENHGEIKGKKSNQVVHRTVGYCKDCGFTWYPEDSTKKPAKRKTWLWVLGWIFIFPVPLTILMLRKKEMKPVLKYGIIAAGWIIYLLIGFGGNSSNTTVTGTGTTPAAVEETNANTSEQQEPIEVIYSENDRINAFLNTYNMKNPDDIITSDMFHIYHHHGSDHKDQILFDNKNDFEISISDSSIQSIKIVMNNVVGNEYRSEEEYKQQFSRFIRCYDTSLTDAQIEEWWQTLMNDDINSVEFGEKPGELNASLQIYKENIEVMIIEGRFKA